MEEIETMQKVWKTGTTLVIAIPKKVIELFNIEKGDYVKLSFKDITKTSEQIERAKKERKKTKEVKDIMRSDWLPEMG